MGVISNNLTSDNSDKSFLSIFSFHFTHSLSRCSISPTGQFTIGTVNKSFSPQTPHKDVSHTAESSLPAESTSHSPIGDLPSNAPSVSPAEVPSPALSPSLVSEDSGELPEMDIADAPSIADVPSKPRRSRGSLAPAHDDTWRLEDPYDDGGNRPHPYSRGKVFLDREDVKRKNSAVRQRKQTSPAGEWSSPAELYFTVGVSALEVFK